MRVLREIIRDSLAIARRYHDGRAGAREILNIAAHDGSQVLALSRLREAARRWRIPLANTILRRVQTALFSRPSPTTARRIGRTSTSSRFAIIACGT